MIYHTERSIMVGTLTTGQIAAKFVWIGVAEFLALFVTAVFSWAFFLYATKVGGNMAPATNLVPAMFFVSSCVGLPLLFSVAIATAAPTGNPGMAIFNSVTLIYSRDKGANSGMTRFWSAVLHFVSRALGMGLAILLAMATVRSIAKSTELDLNKDLLRTFGVGAFSRAPVFICLCLAQVVCYLMYYFSYRNYGDDADYAYDIKLEAGDAGSNDHVVLGQKKYRAIALTRYFATALLLFTWVVNIGFGSMANVGVTIVGQIAGTGASSAKFLHIGTPFLMPFVAALIIFLYELYAAKGDVNVAVRGSRR